MATRSRSYTVGSRFLMLDGFKCGFVKAFEGGRASAEVVEDRGGPGYFNKKHIATVKYEDISLQIDLSLAKAVYDWIAASWKGNTLRKDGSISTADHNLNVKSEREFFNALITEITVPKMDAGSKEPCFLGLRLASEFTRFKKSTGMLSASPGKGRQKQWLPANFRLEIDGLDCTQVSMVDAFTVKQGVAVEPVGEMREYQRGPGKIEFPNLRITLPESASEPWFEWFEDFVVKGNCGDDQEKNGSLTFLAPNLKDELARIDFFHIGICRMLDEKPQPQPDSVWKVVAELYCERMEFVFSP